MLFDAIALNNALSDAVCVCAFLISLSISADIPPPLVCAIALIDIIAINAHVNSVLLLIVIVLKF